MIGIVNDIFEKSENLLPERLRDDELFKYVTELMDVIYEKYAEDMRDVSLKYISPDDVSEQTVKEVFLENGLKSVVDLFDTFDDIDFATILYFSTYILLFKGHRSGYELVLKLVGFDYDMVEWWETDPKGKENTFSISLNISSSTVSNPYQTFQKVKKFTAEYVLPIISPLFYNYDVTIDRAATTCLASHHETFFGEAEATAIDADLWGNSTFYLLDELSQVWNIQVNNEGTLRTTLTLLTEASFLFRFIKDDSIDLYSLSIDSGGNLTASVDLDDTKPTYNNFYLPDNKNRGWLIKLDEFDTIYTELI
jgi:hypothetical protein